MTNSNPNRAKRLCCCLGDQNLQLLIQCAQFKSPIEAMAVGGEAARNVFLGIEVTPATGQTGLWIVGDVMIHRNLGTSFGSHLVVTGG